MYVHGSNKNIEYKKPDHSFYKGIVIDDFDPRKMLRLKIFIPELSNQPSFFEDSESAQVRYPNSQVPGLDVKEVDTLKELLPYAEQCAPLMGESGLSRFYAPDGTQPGKGNQPKDTDEKRNEVPTVKKGGIMPRVLSMVSPAAGSLGTAARIIDAWADGKYGKQNTTGSAFGPKNSGPEASGAYGVPQVGAHLWVFHHRGDYNFPVYFGVAPSYRETAMVYANGGYPDSGYESNQGDIITPTSASVTGPPGEPVSERADLGKIDNDTKRLLYELTQAEVGGQGEEAQTAFMETVANRAAIQNTSIRDIITNRAYYAPLQTGKTRPVSTATRTNYDRIFNTVVGGSNITSGATHNASGDVAARWNTRYQGQPGTRRDIGGETFYSKTYEQQELIQLGLL